MVSVTSSPVRPEQDRRVSLDTPLTSAQARKQACENCWKRKNKCDKQTPCSSCTDLRIECRPRQWRWDNNTEEVAVTHASVTSYVDTLKRNASHSRAQEPEGRRTKRARTASSRHDRPAFDAGATPCSLESPMISHASEAGNLAESPSVQATMGEIGFLSRSAMAEPRSDLFERLPTNLTSEGILLASLALDGSDPSKSSLSDPQATQLFPGGGSSWHLVGLALRKCISQGWHRHQESTGQLTESDLVLRKRLFWSAYMIDRSLSLVMGRPFSIHDRDISVTVLKPHEATSLHCHLITQARLATDIQVNSRPALLHDYSNICFWRQWTGDQDSESNVKSTVPDHLLQLECRMLAKITSMPPDHQNLRRSSAAVMREVDRETIEACTRYVDRIYERFQDNNFVGSFIEAYDLFTASLTVVHLKRRDVTSNTQQQLASMMDVINKSSTLLTVVAERFSMFRGFQRVLLSLSGHLMANTIPGAQDNPNIEDMLPESASESLRSLIKLCVQ
ncbi:hypothetical protein G7054_g679 [Neopestalotiopsis clavispora]|nr:hypothetical protein G7054_g679 [Neopestalotiopsis clavispora]